MVTQMRVVLDGHAGRGGRYREVVVEDAGHFVFTQDPDRFAALLAEHLKDVACPSRSAGGSATAGAPRPTAPRSSPTTRRSATATSLPAPRRWPPGCGTAPSGCSPAT